MKVILLSFVIICLSVLGLAIGILFGKRPLQGGCGETGKSLGAGIGCGACGVEEDFANAQDRQRNKRPSAPLNV